MPAVSPLRRLLLPVSLLLVGAFLAPGTARSQTSGKPAAAGSPPLIDRELFFGNPEIAGAQLSPDGQFIAFIKPYKDTRNVWVKKTTEPFSAAKLITADTKRPIPGYFWSRDSKYILFVQDQAGDENYNVYAVNPADSPAAGQDAPAARNITAAKRVRALIYDVPKNEPDAMFVGLNDRDAAWHDLYKVKISTGERTLLRKNTEKIARWIFDNNGQLRLAAAHRRQRRHGDPPRRRRHVSRKCIRAPCSRAAVRSASTRTTSASTCIPTKASRPDGPGAVRSGHGQGRIRRIRSAQACRFRRRAVLRSHRRDPRDGLRGRAEAPVFQGQVLRGRLTTTCRRSCPARRSASGRPRPMRICGSSSASSDNEPGETYLFDRQSRAAHTSVPHPGEAAARTPRVDEGGPLHVVDGLEIPAFLTLPKGVPAKNLPAVRRAARRPVGARLLGLQLAAAVPGEPRLRGPAAELPRIHRLRQEVPERRQQPVGRQDAGRRDLAGAKYLVAEGIADPKRIGIMGGSYGGYATLAGVAFTPDLYAAGVSIVGPSNLITLLETIPPYWEAGRKIFHKRMGDPTTPEGKEAARTAVAAQLGRPDQDAACSSRRAPTTRASSRPSRIRSWSRCGIATSRSSTSWRLTKATASHGR